MIKGSLREIHVRAVGEQRLHPDRVKIVIVIANQKETAEEVKASVARREEYVLQVWLVCLPLQFTHVETCQSARLSPSLFLLKKAILWA